MKTSILALGFAAACMLAPGAFAQATAAPAKDAGATATPAAPAASKQKSKFRQDNAARRARNKDVAKQPKDNTGPN